LFTSKETPLAAGIVVQLVPRNTWKLTCKS
jgi:hypothetical protein